MIRDPAPDPSFGPRVLTERRLLAERDPNGERESIAPLLPIWDIVAEADGLVTLADVEPTPCRVALAGLPPDRQDHHR